MRKICSDNRAQLRQSEGLSGFDNKWRTRDHKPAFACPIRDQGSADHILEGG